MCFPGMAFFMVLILILQQKNDIPDLPFCFTLSFFYFFKNANSLPGKRSTAGCFYLIKPKKARIFGIFPKRKHCTIVSFVQCSYVVCNLRYKYYKILEITGFLDVLYKRYNFFESRLIHRDFTQICPCSFLKGVL